MGKLLLIMNCSTQNIDFRSPALNRSKSQMSVAQSMKSQDSVPSGHNDFVDEFDDEFEDDVSIPVPPINNYGVSFSYT